VRWQTLDVWIVALDEAGFEPFSVFDRRIWDSNAHLYYSFGFISFRGGTFVSLTSDSTSGRVCLLVEGRGMKFDVSRGRRHPRNPSLKKLTSNWKPVARSSSQSGSVWKGYYFFNRVIVYKAFLDILGIILRYDNWRSFVILPVEHSIL
jgi:hypothetical protein